MNFAWKFMLPMALINILRGGRLAVHGGGLGALGCLRALVFGPYVALARMLAAGKSLLTARIDMPNEKRAARICQD